MIDVAFTAALAAAYASYGVAAVITPSSGTGPVACTILIVPAEDGVANLLRTGDRFAGYRCRVRQDELAARPREGDVIAITGEGLALRVKQAHTQLLDAEWLIWAVPLLAPTVAPSAGVGHLMPPLLGGWAWA